MHQGIKLQSPFISSREHVKKQHFFSEENVQVVVFAWNNGEAEVLYKKETEQRSQTLSVGGTTGKYSASMEVLAQEMITGRIWGAVCEQRTLVPPLFRKHRILSAASMPQAFDKCKERPQHIEEILNGLNRYNPETTTVFQEYISQQCEEKFFDVYASVALLKLYVLPLLEFWRSHSDEGYSLPRFLLPDLSFRGRMEIEILALSEKLRAEQQRRILLWTCTNVLRSYQFNPHLLHPETVTNVLVKALTVFPSPAFSLCLALLPASSIPFGSDVASIPTTELTESIQKLTKLNTLLESAQYDAFWSTLESDDIYADLYADVAGFEDLIRIRIAGEVGKTFREIDLGVLSGWLNLRADALNKFCQTACGWNVSDQKVEIPANAENEAKSEVKGERVGVDMFGRVFRRGYEAPA